MLPQKFRQLYAGLFHGFGPEVRTNAQQQAANARAHEKYSPSDW
jgi:hypothetical protein